MRSPTTAAAATSVASTVANARTNGYTPPRGTRGRMSLRFCRSDCRTSRCNSAIMRMKVRNALAGSAK